MNKYLGIEFGSTRIKGVLINDKHQIIASGAFTWENKLVNGKWTYSLTEAKKGLQQCYLELKADYENKYHEKLTAVSSIGVSGMMHGYLVLDKDNNLLHDFLTWRNTVTEEASAILTEKLGFQIPQRWSSSHVYQAILNKQKEVKDIAFATTLAGYFHYLFTGKKVIGIGEASGMFPIDIKTKNYNQKMVSIFNNLIKDEVSWKLEDIFPKVLLAGDNAGYLTIDGRDLIDPSQELEIGIPLCPPEGDMGTGMVCTNSVKEGTGNASIGTSSNITIITNRDIHVYKEIDVITTPSGTNAALVHVNNGTSEINAWEKLFKEVSTSFNEDVSDGDIYSLMFNKALEGDKSIKGLYAVDYLSGEPITHFNEGKLLLLRDPDAEFNLANFMRLHINSLLGTIKIGINILVNNEGIKLNKIVGHGGFFKTPKVGQYLLSASLNTPVVTLSSASEGGPYGQALLAAYLIEKEDHESLEDYLEKKVFASQDSVEIKAEQEDVLGFEEFFKGYEKSLLIEKEAISVLKNKDKVSPYQKLKEEVYAQNMRLYKEGLITLTWGNVSGLDEELKVFAIKPSGVPYESLKPSDMVVLDLKGNIIEGKLRPSSDTPTHLALYQSFPAIRGVVHTHSTYAVAFAQAQTPIKALGTTHADTFKGEVPCTRLLSKEEIEGDYELNTGKVIIETFKNLDYEATPGVIVASHGPFAWGDSPKDAVDHAIILEKVAEMNLLTKLINKDAPEIDKNLENKHYQRKHGKGAYYGQK